MVPYGAGHGLAHSVVASGLSGRYYADIRQAVPASDQEMNSLLAELSRVRLPLVPGWGALTFHPLHAVPRWGSCQHLLGAAHISITEQAKCLSWQLLSKSAKPASRCCSLGWGPWVREIQGVQVVEGWVQALRVCSLGLPPANAAPASQEPECCQGPRSRF